MKQIFSGKYGYIAYMVVGAAVLFTFLWFTGKTTYAAPSFMNSAGSSSLSDEAGSVLASNSASTLRRAV